MKQIAILYTATLLVMAIMDMLWIGGLAKNFYKERMGDLLEFQMLPAILFYLMYSAGIVIFVSNGATAWQNVALYGALLGFLCYGTYDFTNMATIRGWSWGLLAVDMAWGTFTTGVAATAGWLVAGYFRA